MYCIVLTVCNILNPPMRVVDHFTFMLKIELYRIYCNIRNHLKKTVNLKRPDVCNYICSVQNVCSVIHNMNRNVILNLTQSSAFRLNALGLRTTAPVS